MFNIGILGCGGIARSRHAPEYALNSECCIYGFYNPTRSKAEEMAAQYGGKVYDSADELINDPAIDAVSVCTANYAHAELSIKAMRAGKHVLCEKPMAISLEEAEEMVKVSKETGKLLMIGHNQRFMPAHAEGKKLLDEGVIGRVISFRTCFGHGGPDMLMKVKNMNSWFFRKETAAMGALADLGVHKIDLIQYLLGDSASKVSALLKTADKRTNEGDPISVEDNGIFLIEMNSGVIGTATASWTYYGFSDNSTVLYGTKGVMRMYDDPQHSLVINLADRSTIIGEAPPFDFRARSGLIDSWVESMKAGKVLMCDGESALSAMKTVFAAIESSNSSSVVEIR